MDPWWTMMDPWWIYDGPWWIHDGQWSDVLDQIRPDRIGSDIERGRRMEIGDQRSEVGDWRSEIGDWRSEIGDRGSERRRRTGNLYFNKIEQKTMGGLRLQLILFKKPSANFFTNGFTSRIWKNRRPEDSKVWSSVSTRFPKESARFCLPGKTRIFH